MPSSDNPEIDSDVHLLWVGCVVEGLLIALALLLSLFGLYDHSQPLEQLNQTKWLQGLGWGIVATLPMLIFLVVFHYFPMRLLQPMRDFCDSQLRPMFAGSTLTELALLALLAGFGEELLFRWCLQGGLTTMLSERAGAELATIIGLIVASVLFGLCHWVNNSYGLTTLAIGLFLGATMIWAENWLVPAFAHAFYDFVALLYLVRPINGESDYE